jgi:hypothetical protein
MAPSHASRFRKGRGEALDRGMHGHGIEPRNHPLRGADAVGICGRQHELHRHREAQLDPARSETRRTCRTSSRENREVPASPVVDGTAGRIGKAEAVRR